jgi:acetolactate synthase-1/2/3 large subunit
MGPIMNWLEKVLPDDAILTNGAGNYATWVHRFHRFRRFATQAHQPRARWAMACRPPSPPSGCFPSAK